MISAQDLCIPIRIDAGAGGFPRRGEPITLGVAVPLGRVHGTGWSLRDAAGAPVPVQVAERDRWSDGSTRWLLADFRADVPAAESATYELRFDPAAPAPAPHRSLHIVDDGQAVVVRTGAADFSVGRSGGSLVSRVEAGGAARIEAGAAVVIATDAAGGEHRLEVADARLELSGPLRSVVRVDGVIRLPGAARLDVTGRLHFFADLPVVRIELSITNPRAARHDAGFWDLGDSGSLTFRDLSVVFTSAAPVDRARASVEESDPMSAIDTPIQIYQDSSGGEHWNSRTHVNPSGALPLVFRGYRLSAGAHAASGLRAAPIVTAGDPDWAWTVSVPQFWQNFPKALEVSDTALTVRLWPKQSAEPHELQGGERKTHAFVAALGRDPVSEIPLAWSRSPAPATASAASYEAAGVWRPLSSGTSENRTAYLSLIQSAIEGDQSFSAKRERIDEYGWRHFGDIYADHEAVNVPGLVSHYNNQYDAIAGCATRFCATGDRRWWTAMDDVAAHVADVDIYHCSDDRAAYNHGLFWHTSHYQDAGTGTHRAYSRRAGASSGGPSNEHNYTTGLLLHYFLTGCERSREAVLELAGWVLDMDDGAKGRFRWIDRGDTGLASATRDPGYHGPGRGAAYSINALLDAHQLTGEQRYLEKADRLVERCVHPADDPATMNLLDAESRWSYTVFLQVLGRYLEYRAEKGQTDSRFEYARAVLVTYAQWMAAHERPYLDHPEQLEYPTETWAAQDIRKAAVFEFAGRWAPDPDTGRAFTRCADRFFDYSVSTLVAMETRFLSRPIVLLLAYGFQRPLMHASAALPASSKLPVDWPRRRSFVPYRRRVMTRLTAAAAVIAATTLVALWLVAFR